MYQVVTNLLGNALKFTRPAAPSRSAPAGRPDAVLEVADTGVGIPAEELPRIFDRFWRGQAAAQTSGSGIGLAIAAELARAHGGTLTAVSAAWRGDAPHAHPAPRLSVSTITRNSERTTPAPPAVYVVPASFEKGAGKDLGSRVSPRRHQRSKIFAAPTVSR